jgi:hypothetical protein
MAVTPDFYQGPPSPKGSDILDSPELRSDWDNQRALPLDVRKSSAFPWVRLVRLAEPRSGGRELGTGPRLITRDRYRPLRGSITLDG